MFVGVEIDDLLNRHIQHFVDNDNISPANVDKLWFEQADSFDLDEFSRFDADNPDDMRIVRCNTLEPCLDSPLLSVLLNDLEVMQMFLFMEVLHKLFSLHQHLLVAPMTGTWMNIFNKAV